MQPQQAQPTVVSPHAAGLSSATALLRLAQFGRNELRATPSTPRWRVFLRQFSGPLVILLIAACGLSALLGEWLDASAIFAILLVNAAIGYRQECSAETAVRALQAMTAPRARVLRDGFAVELLASEVVPGDCLLLQAGDIVAADAQLQMVADLQTVEAALTGESEPVRKGTAPCAGDAPLAERTDQVFAGTKVAAGSGRAEVMATGMDTQIGRIAGLLNQAPRLDTPLQQRLAVVGRTLLWLCLAVVAVVTVQAIRQGRPWLEVVLTAVSLAVAAVPEGLPVMVTVALAVGVQRMAARHVLVRRLPAVETLGCTTVICTDKTGTLTRGEMALREVWGADPLGVLEAAALCCDADPGDPAQGMPASGDPTELAILAGAAERGIDLRQLDLRHPRLASHPFDANRKRMSVWRDSDGRGCLYVKGAVDGLAPLATTVPAGLLSAAEELASRGLRVLGVATAAHNDETELTLLGLVGLADPPRPEAIQAVQAARQAGIHIVMITGDHPRTAAAIATEMGILDATQPPSPVVHARATPEDKLRIVADWQAQGAVVAMTGDGVNDAPALERADIGIAMGRSGTEVTRQAADMVLADDNFASIVDAIREGRAIFSSIRRALVFLLTGNFAELGVMFGAALAGWPVPLMPLQILWINLVTDGAPSLALVLEPAHPDTLDHPPRPRAEPILGAQQWLQIVVIGGLETVIHLLAFRWALDNLPLPAARTVVFTCVACTQLWRSLAARSERLPWWRIDAKSNPRLWAVLAITLAVQIALAMVPEIGDVWALGQLTWPILAGLLSWSMLPMIALEAVKRLSRGKA